MHQFQRLLRAEPSSSAPAEVISIHRHQPRPWFSFLCSNYLQSVAAQALMEKLQKQSVCKFGKALTLVCGYNCCSLLLSLGSVVQDSPKGQTAPTLGVWWRLLTKDNNWTLLTFTFYHRAVSSHSSQPGVRASLFKEGLEVSRRGRSREGTSYSQGEAIIVMGVGLLVWQL